MGASVTTKRHPVNCDQQRERQRAPSLNFRDERYLPFEDAGVISTWRLELSESGRTRTAIPLELPQFDFDTIVDVILHMRYTARDGGQVLKQKAVSPAKRD